MKLPWLSKKTEKEQVIKVERARCTKHALSRRDLHMPLVLELLHWHLIPQRDAEKHEALDQSQDHRPYPVLRRASCALPTRMLTDNDTSVVRTSFTGLKNHTT